jgi:hypothetical protein
MHAFVSERTCGSAILSCFAAWAIARAGNTGALGTEPAALVINQHEVSREEFRWFMEQERGGVFRHFKTRHNLEDGRGFWTHEIEGTTPKAMLQSNSVARITREKVEQILFRELGLVQDISYATFLAQLERLNEERERAAKLGRTVYGPVRYTQLQYYQHWKATLRAQAGEKLAEKQWAPREEDLRKFYNENRDLFRVLPLSTLEVVTVQARKKPAAAERADAVRSAAGMIRARFQAGSTLADVLKGRWGDDRIEVSGQRFEEINADRLGELLPDEEELKAVLALAPGGTVLLVDSDAGARVVRCLGKTAGEARPYEAVQRQVRERWLAQQYDRHIERLVSQAKVQVNQEALDALSR